MPRSTDALDAYAALGELGEEIEDEWSYVADLGRRLARRGSRRWPTPAPARPIDPSDAGAPSTAPSTRSARIEDPHRAIDWLSTFPQVVLLALGEPP